MAVFFDKHVEFPSPSGGVRIHHAVEWHSKHAILAVASKCEATDAEGSVNFYMDEGELIEDATIQRSVCVECMQWHPVRRIAAMGWQSGEITLYNDHGGQYYEQSSLHRSPLTVLKWNKSGSRIISADKSGLLAVWNVDPQGKIHPVPIHQHRLQSTIVDCVMLHPLATPTIGKRGSVLDAYTWQRKGAAQIAESIQDPIACFIITQGAMLFMNHSGVCSERCHINGSVHSILMREDMELMAVLTHEMGLSQYSVTYDGQTSQTMNAKLSTVNKATCLIWVGGGVLASCSGEAVVRFWDFEGGDNYSLGLGSGATPEEVVTCISYNSERGVLAGGTDAGTVVMWKFIVGETSLEGPDQWEHLTSSSLAAPPTQLQWGSEKQLLVANCTSTVQILSEHVMNAHYNQQVSAVQVSPSDLVVECHNTGLLHTVKAAMHVRGVAVNREDVMVWSGRKLAVYAFSQDKPTVRDAGSFSTETLCAVLYEHSVYTIEKGVINVRAFQGTVKQVLSFSEVEGSPLCLGVGGHHLVAATDTGYVKAWDLARREAKLHCSRQLLGESAESSRITSVQCNCNGSKISILSNSADSQLHQLTLWDVDTDTVKIFSPASILDHTHPPENHTPQYTTLPPELPESAINEQHLQLRALINRDIVSIHWDSGDPRLMVLATGGKAIGGNKAGKHTQAISAVLVSLLVGQDVCVVISDVLPMKPTWKGLVGVSVPFLYINQKGGEVRDTPSFVAPVTMRGFSGLEESDEAALHAMMEFTYHSTIGNMEEAFRAIKLIKSEGVWENMARMCVKTQRLDVAAVCLGNMGSARGAKAVREAMRIPEPEARLAVLAVQLGMLEEAEDLYKRSKRYDLLNKFYQACGSWKKAVEVAELNDRMHLKTTYYNYGRHAEGMGELIAAINCYEKSGTHQFEVPRMLLEDPLELENYVMRSKDKGIRKWWAEYLESMGEWEQAMQFYETAKDYYSLVRLLCFNGQVERAMELAEESGSKAACYHLARRLSMDTEDNDPRKAIHFYTKAQCYTPALQLAKELGLGNDLMRLALLSSHEDMIDAARYYEENPDTLDKAIMLYHKGGEISKALELCFQHREFEVLHQIADDLSEDSSPEMTKRVADYFIENSQFDKAMELLVKSKQVGSALELCLTHHIKLTEDMIEGMTPHKQDKETPLESERRVQLLERLADCCAEQGAYHLATKKYTQAGNKTKAMKCLLKSGDTEKIIFFAGVSRQKEIYIMAANYLQSLDWRNNPEIIKNIINFYTKGRAYESLAGYYDACAQAEIDEFQNYGKAVGALNEALKCLSKAKSKNPASLEAKAAFLKERVDLIQRFAEARSVYESEPDECIKQCQSLLDEPNLDTAIRMGDVFGLIIEHYGQTGSYQKAYSLMEEMRQRLPTVNMTYYVDIRTIEAIHSGLGIPLGRGVGGGDVRPAPGDESDDSVGEEVDDVF